ncbi:MAG: peptidyl-prolyl cis-trans isomerase, partial [Muribaculaceae bacterium]|nr:peptidyl-prolyl cis-trans isomerase [Muribaculaceae bacterium]
MAEDVDVSHIMLQLGMNPSEADSLKNALNNIRTEIINGASFEEMALKHSIDGYAKHNKGRMGFISAGKYPYTFEDAAYDTPVGEISHVIETPFGYHIVKVHGRRPA